MKQLVIDTIAIITDINILVNSTLSKIAEYLV